MLPRTVTTFGEYVTVPWGFVRGFLTVCHRSLSAVSMLWLEQMFHSLHAYEKWKTHKIS